MNSNNSMTLSGNFKPFLGKERYTITFKASLTSDKTFVVSVKTSALVYSIDDKRSSLGLFQIKKGTKDFSFYIYWIGESADNNLMVSEDKAGPFGSVWETVQVVSNKCNLFKELSEVKVGNSFFIKALLPLLKNYSTWVVTATWNYSNGGSLIQNGEYTGDKETYTVYLPLKAMKTGRVLVSVAINITKGNEIRINSFYKGSLEFEIKNPYSISMDNVTDFACVGTNLTYRLNGLGLNPNVEETIHWRYNDYGKLLSVQGKTPAYFEIIKTGGLFKVSVEVKADNQTYSISSTNSVWIGKPTLDTGISTEHTMTSGDEITLSLTEFHHYSGNIEYNIESGNKDMIDIKRISANELMIKSVHPKIVSDNLKIGFTAGNICGEVSDVHTIVVEAGPGSSLQNPFILNFSQNHLINFNQKYNLKEYGGNVRLFKLYFAFSLTRKVQFSAITALSVLGSNVIKLYDDKQNELQNLESSNYRLCTEMLQVGRYYLIIDAQNDVAKEDILELSLYGGAAGGDHPSYPYVIDANATGFEFKDRIDTSGYYKEFKYMSENGEMIIHDKTNRGGEVFYSLKLRNAMQFLIDTVTDSTINAEFHIMQGEPYDWKVLYHDEGRYVSYDVDLQEWDGKTRWKKILGPGEYVFVFNGVKWGNAGQINGAFSLHLLGRIIKGASFDDSYELGHYTKHTFTIAHEVKDILAHRTQGVEKLFFHLSIEANVNMNIQALVADSELLTELYDSDRKKIAPSVESSSFFEDLLGADYYFAVSLQTCLTDSFKLNLFAGERGHSALSNMSYNMGAYDNDFTFKDDINTDDGSFYDVFRYKDADGNYPYISVGTNHFYYKITLLRDMILSIDANWRFTELHVLQGEPYEWQVLCHRIPENDPNNIVPTEMALIKGEYKLVVNRVKLSNAGSNNGPISFSITGYISPT